MLNTYTFKENEILIEAPGSANYNRLKNDLIWEINSYLSKRYALYMFFLCKSQPVEDTFFSLLGLSRKYIAFQKLDSRFINRCVKTEEEITCYRTILDPLKKMTEDVFYEACCMENVDMQYVAIEDIGIFTRRDITFKSAASFNRWVTSTMPVYVSLFGAREMKIVINCNDVKDDINRIVFRHCSKKD